MELLFGGNRQSPYICNVIFFIVLDLRLTKVGVRRDSFFFALTLSAFLSSPSLPEKKKMFLLPPVTFSI